MKPKEENDLALSVFGALVSPTAPVFIDNKGRLNIQRLDGPGFQIIPAADNHFLHYLRDHFSESFSSLLWEPRLLVLATILGRDFADDCEAKMIPAEQRTASMLAEYINTQITMAAVLRNRITHEEQAMSQSFREEAEAKVAARRNRKTLWTAAAGVTAAGLLLASKGCNGNMPDSNSQEPPPPSQRGR